MRDVWNSLLGLSHTIATLHTTQEADIRNANHIFNAIHSSMRQWGSSLNHNGMSFFLATVPEDTQLYHGSNNADQVSGTEWLAFEPEHALVFAHYRHGPPPDEGGPHEHLYEVHHPDHDEHDDVEVHHHHHQGNTKGRAKYMPWPHDDQVRQAKSGHIKKDESFSRAPRHRTPLGAHQHLLAALDGTFPLEDTHGYLHTYRTRHDLRLLYIDGQSAAKSSKGTLDSQDVVLLHDNPPPSRGDREPPLEQKSRAGKPRPGGPMGESFRAEHLCKMANTQWAGRIDGFLRMELGFEIILCSFEKDLELELITQAKEIRGGRIPGYGDSDELFSYYRAVASRFDGIGGHRVSVDYDSFVTMFAVPDAVYFEDSGLPRIRNETKIIQPVQKEIQNMVLNDKGHNHVNWQAVADMLISRYADRIEYLASGKLADLKSMKSEADRTLRPFIDYDRRNGTAEVERCVAQHVPQSIPSSTTAALAILNIAKTLCSTLLAIESTKSHDQAIEQVRDLKSWLAWTCWKRCRGCSYHEVCFIPIWPIGSTEEHEHPRCVSNMSETSTDYWGGYGNRPH